MFGVQCSIRSLSDAQTLPRGLKYKAGCARPSAGSQPPLYFLILGTAGTTGLLDVGALVRAPGLGSLETCSLYINTLHLIEP